MARVGIELVVCDRRAMRKCRSYSGSAATPIDQKVQTLLAAASALKQKLRQRLRLTLPIRSQPTLRDPNGPVRFGVNRAP